MPAPPRHVRVEIDGQVVVDERVDGVTFENTYVSQGQSRGYRVHRPTREFVLKFRRVEDEDDERH